MSLCICHTHVPYAHMCRTHTYAIRMCHAHTCAVRTHVPYAHICHTHVPCAYMCRTHTCACVHSIPRKQSGRVQVSLPQISICQRMLNDETSLEIGSRSRRTILACDTYMCMHLYMYMYMCETSLEIGSRSRRTILACDTWTDARSAALGFVQACTWAHAHVHAPAAQVQRPAPQPWGSRDMWRRSLRVFRDQCTRLGEGWGYGRG